MSVPFLPAIDLAQGANSQGLGAESLSHVGAVYAVASQQTIDAAFDHLKQTATRYATFFDCTKLDNLDDIVLLLDAGAAKVFVSSSQLQNIQNKNVDASRLILSLAGAANSALEVLEGNEVGYTSIVGAGTHGTSLHWWRNNGTIVPGSLLLV